MVGDFLPIDVLDVVGLVVIVSLFLLVLVSVAEYDHFESF